MQKNTLYSVFHNTYLESITTYTICNQINNLKKCEFMYILNCKMFLQTCKPKPHRIYACDISVTQIKKRL